MKPLTNKTPQLLINPNVKAKMDALVLQSNKEIQWHGFINKIDANTYYWYDIILFPQKVTAATTTTDDTEYANWEMRQMQFKNYKDMRLHGHSHVNMGVTPSGVDRTYRENLIANCNTYYIFLIVNKKGAYNLEIYDIVDRTLFETSDIEVTIGTPETIKDASNWTSTAIKNNVKEETCSTTSKAKKSSIQKALNPSQYMSSDVGALEVELQQRFQDLALDD